MIGASKMTEVAKGKFLYGIVTVGERGQIVIPKEARDQFDIKPRDKLIVVGDIEKGLGVVKADAVKEFALKILGFVGKAEKKEDGRENEE
jgi:AbrB family looped-hinge helix DNA binding protein